MLSPSRKACFSLLILKSKTESNKTILDKPVFKVDFSVSQPKQFFNFSEYSQMN